MAVASSRRRVGPLGWAVLACVFGLVLSCSGTSQAPHTAPAPEADSSPQGQPPTHTSFFRESEVAWSLGVDEPPEGPDERLLYLVPTSPVEGFDTDAELWRATAGGVPQYSVIVRWPTGMLSVRAVPALSCDPWDDGKWQPVVVRGVEGCEFTNEVGLYFLKWLEGGTSFHYSSFSTTGAEALEMLEVWESPE